MIGLSQFRAKCTKALRDAGLCLDLGARVGGFRAEGLGNLRGVWGLGLQGFRSLGFRV